MGTRNERPATLNEAVIAAIKDYRDDHLNGSDRALARECGLNRATLARLLDGRTTWDVAYLQQIASGLNWSVVGIIEAADPDGELTDFSAGELLHFTAVTPPADDLPEVASEPGRDPGEPENDDA